MPQRPPARYLPTLTEVVVPGAPSASPSLPDKNVLATAPHPTSAQPLNAVPDRNALAQQLIKLVQPQLEAELRNIAQELFEAQFSALLPSLHLQIEEAVREAIDHALPERPYYDDDPLA